MTYKGFELKRHELEVNSIKHVGTGIFKNDRFLSQAADAELAKRAVDAHSETIWKE